MRIGFGFDQHRLVPGRRLILGGVHVPHPTGPAGHSDADVLTHAVCDAVLGAAALGDLGTFFPPSDPTYRDADSLRLLAECAARARGAGLAIGNVDATVVAEAPKLAPYRTAMRENLARALDVAPHRVSVKFTTTEGCDAVGQGDALAAQAVALLVPASP